MLSNYKGSVESKPYFENFVWLLKIAKPLQMCFFSFSIVKSNYEITQKFRM